MVLRLLYLIFLLVGFGRMADAQTTTTPTTTNQSKIVSISSGGYSNLTGLFLGDNNTSTTVIYGGTAGTLVNGCASPSADSTCNNCAADTAPCNKKRIHDNLNLTIQFRPASTSTALPGGLAFVTNNVASGGGLQERLTIINQSPAGLIIPGNVASVSVTVRWGDI